MRCTIHRACLRLKSDAKQLPWDFRVIVHGFDSENIIELVHHAQGKVWNHIMVKLELARTMEDRSSRRISGTAVQISINIAEALTEGYRERSIPTVNGSLKED